eukprot:TRINITY_DN32675_c0_g1_i1.p1 TRINITY_DN32675_c0_g1~~TRINITY_DN32675_c0_g1_i1.p1  ORF type:complete len:438 (-),score=61.63 TRINITY_DN32675_c0_g1_i1:329-1609(-)
MASTGCCQHRRAGPWIDENACAAVCLLILADRVGDGRCSNGSRGRRPLPAFLYSEHIAQFLRFGAPVPNMLYVMGGRNSKHGPVDSVEMLDTWHGQWVSCPRMPRRRAGGAAAALPDGRLLVVGGYDERGIASGVLAACDMYDPFTESWTPAAPLGRARWGLGCATLGGKVYAVGGCSLALVPNMEEPMETLRGCEVYDSETNCWTPCAQLCVPRSGSRVVALGGRRLVAVGGCQDVFGRAEPQSTVEIFDPEIGYWELLGSRLTRPRTSAAVAAIDDCSFFVAGGAPSQLSAEVYCARSTAAEEQSEDDDSVKSLSSNRRIADMVEGRMGCQATVVQLPEAGSTFPLCKSECVLVVGGENTVAAGNGGSTPLVARLNQLRTVAAYDLAAGCWREPATVPSMLEPRTTVALCVGVGRVATARWSQS